MAQGKLGFNRLDPAEKLSRIRAIISRTESNPDFPNPKPSIAELSAAADEMTLAYSAALGGDKQQKEILRTKTKTLLALMAIFLAYVNSTSEGDAVKILSTGLDLRTFVSQKPRLFSAKPAGKKGSVLVKTAPFQARSVKWQYGYDAAITLHSVLSEIVPPDLVWIDAEDTSAASTTISNLKSGMRIWLRYARVYTKPRGGQRPWSDAISILVP